jgi:hypothetical protein
VSPQDDPLIVTGETSLMFPGNPNATRCTNLRVLSNKTDMLQPEHYKCHLAPRYTQAHVVTHPSSTPCTRGEAGARASG